VQVCAPRTIIQVALRHDEYNTAFRNGHYVAYTNNTYIGLVTLPT
jgi:hypothetical protein